jgi:hypothetical protein
VDGQTRVHAQLQFCVVKFSQRQPFRDGDDGDALAQQRLVQALLHVHTHRVRAATKQSEGEQSTVKTEELLAAAHLASSLASTTRRPGTVHKLTDRWLAG